MPIQNRPWINPPLFVFTPEIRHKMALGAARSTLPSVEQAAGRAITIEQSMALNWAGWKLQIEDPKSLAAKWVLITPEGTKATRSQIDEFLAGIAPAYPTFLKPAEG